MGKGGGGEWRGGFHSLLSRELLSRLVHPVSGLGRLLALFCFSLTALPIRLRSCDFACAVAFLLTTYCAAFLRTREQPSGFRHTFTTPARAQKSPSADCQSSFSSLFLFQSGIVIAGGLVLCQGYSLFRRPFREAGTSSTGWWTISPIYGKGKFWHQHLGQLLGSKT